MRKFLLGFSLFLLSFFGTCAFLLQTSAIQQHLIEKLASYVEEECDCRIFFRKQEGFRCSSILVNHSLTIDSLEIFPFSRTLSFKGIDKKYDLNGTVDLRFPTQLIGLFKLTSKGVENSSTIEFQATSDHVVLRLLEEEYGPILESKYTFYAQTRLNFSSEKEGDLIFFLYEEDKPLFHLFSPFDLKNSVFHFTQLGGALYLNSLENRIEGLFDLDVGNKFLDGSLDLNLAENAFNIQKLSFLLKGPLDQIHLKLNSENAIWHTPHFKLEEVALKLEGVITPKKSTAQFKLNGDLEKYPFFAYGDVQVEKGQISLNELNIEWYDFISSLNGTLDLQERILQSKFSLFSNTFKEGRLLLNTKIVSHLNEYFIPESPLIDLTFDATLKEKDQWKIDGLKISLKMDEIEGNYVGECKFKVDQANYLERSIERTAFQWKIREGDLTPFHLEGNISHKPFLLSGSAAYMEKQFKIFFENFIAVIDGLTVSLEKEAFLVFDQHKGLIDGLRLKCNNSTLGISYRWDQENIQLDLEAPSINFTSFHKTLPFFPLKGLCNGKLHFEKIGGRALGSLAAKLQGFEVLDVSYAPFFPLKGDIQVSFNENNAEFHGDFLGPLQEEINILGNIPIVLSPSLFREHDPMAIQVNILGELSPFLKCVMSETTLATGNADCRLEIGGTIADPKLAGTLAVRNGSYESLVMGCVFQEIDALFTLGNSHLTCQSINGRDAFGGTITGRGFLNFESKLPFDFTLEANNVQLLRLDYAYASATGTIHFKGNNDAGKFEGGLTLNSLTINLPDETPTRFNALEVEYINQPPGEKPPTIFVSNSEPWPILLDVNLFFPQEAFVIGSQFSSEWRGNLNLKGSLDDPLLFGDAKVLAANFLINGKNFTSNEGSIHFAGSPGRKSSLYITSKHDINDIEIGIILKGSIKEPQLAFRSNPPKSTREILSWLLFNKGISDISPFENAELSQNIINLSDQMAAGPNFLDRLKSSFGIDRIDFTSSDENNPDDVSVRVGKYITNRLFLSLKKSINDQPNQASIEADLSNNFKAQAEVNDDAEAHLMLKWEKDY